MKKIKIFKYTVHGDSGVNVQYGTKHDVVNWKDEQECWEEEGFSCCDDTIEEVMELDSSISKQNLQVILSNLEDQHNDN